MRTPRVSLTALISFIVLVVGLALVSAPALAVVGRFQLPFSPFGAGFEPTGIGVDQSSGNVFVVDSADRRVLVFSAEGGVPVGGIPAELTGVQTPAGKFKFGGEPAGVTVDNACFQHKLSGAACAAFDSSSGAIYVTDVAQNVVDKFGINGSNEYEYMCQFTGFGFVGSACLKNEPTVEGTPTEGSFNEPLGVAVDREGNVYVADFGEHRIAEFNSAGEDVRVISSAQVTEPQDIAVDSSGDIYVRQWREAGGPSHEVELKRGSFTGAVESETNAHEGTTGVAFDLAAGRLFLGFGSLLTEYNEVGEALGSFGSETGLSEGRGVAVNETTSDVYVANRTDSRVYAFGPVVTLGTATTGPASGVGPNSATVQGTVNPESKTLEATCEVQYGKTTAYGQSVPCSPEKIGTGEKPVPVTAELAGLEAGTLYYYRVVAVNENGKNPGPEATLTTAPAVQGVLTSEATEVGKTCATLNGSLKPNGITTHYYFEYGETPGFGSTSPAPPGTEAELVETAPAITRICGLNVNTTYYYRLAASNAFGTTDGETGSFATLPNVPVVTSESASRIFPRQALLAAIVNPENSNTTYHFAYGPTAGYGSSAPGSDIELGTGSAGLQALLSVSGLQPGTTYHYAVVASNRGGSTYGPDETFTTPAAGLPTVTTGAAGEVSQNSASISGTVNPQGAPTSYEFDIGTDTTYGSRISGEAGAGVEARTLTLSLQGLAAGTLYHYRLVATNTFGTVYGADQTFMTPGFPSALLVSPVGAPLVPTPAFNAPAVGGAVTVSGAPAKHKPKAKTKRKPKVKKRGRKASRANHGRGGSGR